MAAATRPSLESLEHDNELERAQAAHWLLDEMHLGGELGCLIDPRPVVLKGGGVGTWRPGKTEKAHAYWLTRMALHELDEALTELRRLTDTSRRNESA